MLDYAPLLEGKVAGAWERSRFATHAWAGAIGAAAASSIGFFAQLGAGAADGASARAAGAALSIGAALGALGGAAATFPSAFTQGAALAGGAAAVPVAIATLKLWQRPAFGGPGMRVLLVLASVLLPLLVALLFSRARRGMRARAAALASLALLGGAAALAGIQPLARLHGALRVSCFALSTLLFGLVALELLKRRAWTREPAIAAASWLALLAACAIALGDPDARLAFSEKASIGREVLAALAPLGLWRQKTPSVGAPAVPAPTNDAAPPVAAGVPIILISIDSLRTDCLSAYGGPADLAPNLNRFFESALVFDRAYAAYPATSVSVPSLLTGRIVWGPLQRWRDLMQRRPGLGALLAPAGYDRSAFVSPLLNVMGVNEEILTLSPPELGFNEGAAQSLSAPERARAVSEALGARPGKSGVFVWAHFPEPHAPYDLQPGFDRGSSDRQRYDGEVAFVDHALGPLLARLAALDAIVWITADHGEAFGEHGQTLHASSLYDEQIRVPLALRAPGLAARRVRGAVSLLDVVPTTLGLVGLPAPAALDGTDLQPRASADRAAHRAFALFENRTMLALGDHKLLCDAVADACALYDLRADPRELSNVSSQSPELEARLTSELTRFVAAEAPAGTSIRSAVAIRETRELALSVPELALGLLVSGSVEQRRAAARAFALAPSLPVEARPALRESSRDDRDREVRAWSAIALANAGDPAADRAVEGLEAIDAPPELVDWVVTLRYRRGLEGSERAARVLSATGAAALRAAIIDAIALRRDRTLARELTPLLLDPELAERAATVLVELAPELAAQKLPPAIERSRAYGARPLLVRLLGDLRALSAGDREAVISALRQILAHAPTLSVRAEAALALRRLGEAVPVQLGVSSSSVTAQRRFSSTLAVEAPDAGDYVLYVSLRRPAPAEVKVSARLDKQRLESGDAGGRRLLVWSVPAARVHAGDNALELESSADLAVLGATLVPAGGGR